VLYSYVQVAMGSCLLSGNDRSTLQQVIHVGARKAHGCNQGGVLNPCSSKFFMSVSA
jgi:hypothetical protein